MIRRWFISEPYRPSPVRRFLRHIAPAAETTIVLAIMLAVWAAVLIAYEQLEQAWR